MNKMDVRIGLYDLVSTVITFHFSFDSEKSANFDYIASRASFLACQRVHNKLSSHFANSQVVGTDKRRVIGLRNIPLEANDCDSRCESTSHYFSKRGALVGRYDQQVRFLSNKRFDLRNLFAVVLLRVGDNQLYVALLVEEALHQLILRSSIWLGIVTLAEGYKIALTTSLVIAPDADQRNGCEQENIP